MSKSQRDKGAGGERELCKILGSEFSMNLARKLGQARDSGNDLDVGQFRIEVKRRAGIAMLRWLEQVETDSPVGKTPVVMMREDGGEWCVLMRLREFLPLMRGELG